MKKLFKYQFLLLCFCGLFLAFYQAQALTISPAKFILSADPGQTLETTMKVRNDSDNGAYFYPVIEKYTVINGEEPVFYPENFGLPIWIKTVPEKLYLAAKETKEVLIRINVPKDAEPGGHYAVIFWSTAPPKGQAGGSGVGITTRVGALVLLDVSGNVVESAEVRNFKSSSNFFRNLPVGFSFDFINNGSVHLKPQGEILIKNFWGKTVAILNANPAEAYALPNTDRVIIASSWEPEKNQEELKSKFNEEGSNGSFSIIKEEINGFAFGYYTANLYVEHGKKPDSAKAKFGFWVIPLKLLFLVLIILSLIILVVTIAIKKYNRWVINMAKERLKNEK